MRRARPLQNLRPARTIRFHKPQQQPSRPTPPHKRPGRSLAVVAALALGSSLVSLLYHKDQPSQFIEHENQQVMSKQEEQPHVVFVLGGPGAGKGTQCARLVKDHGFVHLSAGDLLRQEQQRPGSKAGALIKSCIAEGQIVPQEITIGLLKTAIEERRADGASLFLVDGFPRKMDQAHTFEEQVVPCEMVLFLDCPEDVMRERLLERGKTSGRADDNAAAITKRFRTFVETSMPVVEYYEQHGKVEAVTCDRGVDEVYADVEAALRKHDLL